MKNLYTSYGLITLILAAEVVVSLSTFSPIAIGQTASSNTNSPTIQGITFPIQELGNCSNEADCRAYCNDPSHMQACTVFGENHGLINKQDAERALGFAQALQSGNGPGGCASPDQCKAYCSDITHLDTCISFAKSHGINDEQVTQGEKILAYIQAGGKTPGGCTSQDSCQAYCGDFSHAEECYQFAKAAGIAQMNGQTFPNGANARQSPTPDQLQKLSELAQSGQTPGGCKTEDDCQTYCSDSSHLDECLSFGVKAGFLTQAQAEMIRNTGGKGPGGCNSPQSCQTYCNDPSHQDECFKFAEEHGFINKDDQQRIQNGIVQIRSGLAQAPPEVLACIKSSLGPSILDQIESGNFVPGPDIANQISSCFEKFGQMENPDQILNHLPDQVLSCVKNKLGNDFDKIQSGAETPTPEMADTIRVCFQSIQIQQIQRGQQGFGAPLFPGGEQNQQNGSRRGFQDFLQTAPPEVASCLSQLLGDDFNKLKSGEEELGPEIFQKVQSCFNNFQPEPQNGNVPPPPQPYQGSSTSPIPPQGECPPGAPCTPEPTQKGCPSGTYWNGSLCTGTPYQQIPSSSGTPPLAPCSQGQYWNGTSCVNQTTTNPTTACTQSGGTWTGTTCQIPPPSASSSTSLFPALNSLASILQTLGHLFIRYR